MSISSSSHLPMPQQTFLQNPAQSANQGIEHLKAQIETLQKIANLNSFPMDTNTVDITVRNIKDALEYGDETEVFQEYSKNFCRYDILEYWKSGYQTEKAPKLHFQNMSTAACACQVQGWSADSEKMKLEVGAGNSKLNTWRLEENGCLDGPKALFMNNSKTVAQGVGLGAGAAAGSASTALGADTSTSGTVSSGAKTATEMGTQYIAEKISACVLCKGPFSKDSKEIDRTDLQKTIIALRDKCKSLLPNKEKELASQIRFAGLRQVNDRSNELYREQGEKITRLESELATCKAQLVQVEKDILFANPELKEKVTDLETDQRSLMDRMEGLENQIAGLKNARADLLQKNRTLEEKSERAEAENVEIKAENVEIKAENVFLTQMIGTSEASNAALREGRDFLDGRVTELKERERRAEDRTNRLIREQFCEKQQQDARLSEANIRVINSERAGIQQEIADKDVDISSINKSKTFNERVTAGVTLVALGVILAEAAPVIAVGAGVGAVVKLGHFIVKNDRDENAISEAERAKLDKTRELREKSIERRERAASAERHKEASNLSVRRSA